jgi:UDP-N-acetylglucosamine--N-acetylmuramyl-(pentapeptide) pyrophosphoryl-undecaprenol N-acetylglucosamine transferase
MNETRRDGKHIVIAAGGTGGHVFPALSVALELRARKQAALSLVWIGSTRYRERELCEHHGIPLLQLDVQGIARKISPRAILAMTSFAAATFTVRARFRAERPDAVLAFGGYVCAPVLAAARLSAIPYFLQEQNAVPGLVTRFFANAAVCTFLGFPIAGSRRLKGETVLTRTPVRRVAGTYEDFAYPEGFRRGEPTILICGGSQGAASMNTELIAPVKTMLDTGFQVVWQTGTVSYDEVNAAVGSHENAFVFDLLPDLYPYYAAAKLVIGRAGSSTMNEIAYFGRPCILIPLPWSAENHQWWNAGFGEEGGWAVRVDQNERCGETVLAHTLEIMTNDTRYEKMSRYAIDHTPANAAGDIAARVLAYGEART